MDATAASPLKREHYFRFQQAGRLGMVFGFKPALIPWSDLKPNRRTSTDRRQKMFFRPHFHKLAPWAVVWLLPLLAACNGLFFHPDRVGYYHPRQFDLEYENVNFSSTDGTELTGWFLPAKGAPRGTVVHFHGNAANISNHIVAVQWLPAAGFSVFMFDYRGYGASQGSPSRAGLIEDGIAAIQYVRQRPGVDPDRIIVFGQSLGAPIAIGALARGGTDGVIALIVEGGFLSYREVARRVMNEVWLAWPFQYPAAYLFISDALSPEHDLPRISEIPLLVIHADNDPTVSFRNGKDLFEAFSGKDKEFWKVPSNRHMGVFIPEGSMWRKRLMEYLEKRLNPSDDGRRNGTN